MLASFATFDHAIAGVASAGDLPAHRWLPTHEWDQFLAAGGWKRH